VVCFDVQQCMEYCSFLLALKDVGKCLLQSCCCKLLKNPSCQSALLLTCTTGVRFQCLLPRLDGCFHLVVHRKLQVFVCCQKQQLSLICTSYIPLQEQQKRGSSTIWKICTHTQQPNSHTQQVTTPKNQKGKTKKLQQTLQTAVFDNNGDLGVKSLQTLFM
jgi:hypothetical protein